MVQVCKVAFISQTMNFEYFDYKEELSVMMLAIIIGIALGKLVLDRMSEKQFILLVRILLFAIGFFMIWQGSFGWYQSTF